MSSAVSKRKRDAAEARLSSIRLTAGLVRENLPRLWKLIEEARRAGDDSTLGYDSWTAYVSDAFSDAPMRLPRDERLQLVAMLAGEGMSTRAIAPIIGVHHDTVASDIKSMATVGNPTVEDVGGAEEFRAGGDSATTVESLSSQRTITGLNGKSYAASSPKAPSRKPLTDSAKDVGWELRKAAERLQRIREDDRFSRNKEEVAAHLRGHLMFTVQVCQDLLDAVNQPQEG